MAEAGAMRPRDNGLTAASYAPLADIDPRLTASLLEALREVGVAAYVVSASSRASLGWHVDAPYRPVDRLYVDAGAAARAQEVLKAALPPAESQARPSAPVSDWFARGDVGPVPHPQVGSDETSDRTEPTQEAVPPAGEAGSGPPDLDSAWQQIVAGFDSTPADSVPRWPADEDLRDESTREGRVIRRVEAAEPAELAESPPSAPGQEPDDEHFVPPTPPPLPSVERVTKLAWIGVLGGPAVLLAAAFGLELPSWAPGLAVLAFIGGFVTLVMRLKDRPDSDPDDGAVV
jgi:hypothetical protein